MIKTLFIPLIWIILIALSSCIQNKKVVYLQDKDELNVLPNDSLIQITYPDYRLQIGDILNIDVRSSNPEVSEIFNSRQMVGMGNMGNGNADVNFMNGFPINNNGDIDLPLVGLMNLEGLTLLETQSKIKSEIQKYVTDAYLQVRLSGIRYSALGEFNRPGRYAILQSHVTIFEAVANAGDLTIIANRQKALLIRQYPGGSKVHEIDLTDKQIMKSPFYFIQPNDQLYLEPLPVRQFGGNLGVTGFQTFNGILSALSSILLIYITFNRI